MEEYFSTVVHDSFCKQNHIDGCSWEYEKWENIDKTHEKKKYVTLVKKAIKEGIKLEDFLKISKIFL